MTNETMIVDRVEDQGDRILIYRKEPPSRWGQYHAIAKAGDAAALSLEENDTIVYDAENGGFNFGWFVGIAAKAHRSKA